MSVRVSPTEKIRGRIDALFDGSRDLVEVLEEVARLGAQLIIQAAVEAEVVRVSRSRSLPAGGGVAEARPGSRNGYCPTTVKTTAGPVTIQRPKLRGTSEPFCSRLFGKGVTRSNALESFGDCRVRARIVDPGCGGDAGRCPRRRGGVEQVDGLVGVPGHSQGVGSVEPARVG